MNPQNMAMEQALAGGAAPAGPAPQAPMPGIPPELAQIAMQLGLDIQKPEDLMILLQMLGAGGGGPMGPMAGSPPAGGGPQMPPAGY